MKPPKPERPSGHVFWFPRHGHRGDPGEAVVIRVIEVIPRVFEVECYWYFDLAGKWSTYKFDIRDLYHDRKLTRRVKPEEAMLVQR